MIEETTTMTTMIKVEDEKRKKIRKREEKLEV